MQILHLTNKDYKTSAWSGGTTTELFIWPKGADYARREFSLRISSATVDLPESDFTPLQGVVRYITPLVGSFVLTHPESKPVVLGPLDRPYRFSGETPTHCVGTATDFNLMLKGVEGRMQISGGNVQLQPGLNSFYATQVTVITVQEQAFSLAKGDLLVIFAEEDLAPSLSCPAIQCWADL